MEIFKGPKEKKQQPRILHPAKISFKNKDKINTLPMKKTLKIYRQQVYSKVIAKGSSLDRKERIPEGKLVYQK